MADPLSHTSPAPAAAPASARPGETYYVCGMVLDPVARQLTLDGQRLPLTARLFDMLLYLVEHRDRVVERDELLTAVWAGRRVEEGTVARAISSVRAILREHGAGDNIIATLPNRGYRLTVAVTVAPATTAQVAAAPPRRAIGWPSAVPVVAVAVCAAIFIALWASTTWREQDAPFAPPAHSVAVLPFETPGGDAADGNFADGLAEEVITALGRVEPLRVTSPRSSFKFRGQTATLGDIARRLNVGMILEGSVRRFGGQVHVTAHLTDTITGFETWSKAYDFDAGDALSVQEEIAGDAVTALKVQLLPDQGPRLVLGGTSNRQAYDAFFAGVALLSKGTPDDWNHAIARLTEAIKVDPNFERAYEFRSRAMLRLATGPDNFDDASQGNLFQQAIRDGEKAVILEPDSGTAHGTLGAAVFMLGHDLRRAGDEMAISLRLAPSDASLLAQAAVVFESLGQMQRAAEDARLSVELDPLSPDVLRGAADIYARMHLADAAHAVIQQLKNIAGGDPARLHRAECATELVLGEFAEAATVCQAAPAWIRPFGLAIAQWKLGHKADARVALNEMQAMVKDDGAYQYAEIYAVWGDKQASVHWLSVATRLKDRGLVNILVDEFLLPVRDTPEFDAAARSIGVR